MWRHVNLRKGGDEMIHTSTVINIPFDNSSWTLKVERLEDDSVSVSLHWCGKETRTHSTVLSDEEFYNGFQHLVNWINN